MVKCFESCEAYRPVVTMATLSLYPHFPSLCHECVKLLDWQKQWEGEKREDRMCFGDDALHFCTCRPFPSTNSDWNKAQLSLETNWMRSSVNRPAAANILILFFTSFFTTTTLLFFFIFLGKTKSSGSSPISQIYTSLWKPWSYLTGTVGTDSPDTTTQQMTTARGLAFVELFNKGTSLPTTHHHQFIS